MIVFLALVCLGACVPGAMYIHREVMPPLSDAQYCRDYAVGFTLGSEKLGRSVKSWVCYTPEPDRELET